MSKSFSEQIRGDGELEETGEKGYRDALAMLELAGIPSNYIERDAARLGRAAMEMLLSRISSPDSPKERRQLKPVVNCSRLLNSSR